MAEGRRYSFEDAMARRARELEGDLDLPRQVIRGEGRQQIADVQRVSSEARNGIDHTAPERNTEVHWATAEEWEEPDRTASERSSELEWTGEQQESALERAFKAKATELGGIASGQTDAIERASMDAREKVKQAAAAEARRIDEQVAASHDAMRKAATKETTAFEESLRARLVELEDALRDQATQTRYDMRRAADEEAAAFDAIAGKRVEELQDAVRDHSKLLEEFTLIHASTAEQLEEARSLVGELHQAAQARPADLEAETARQVSMLVQAMAPGADGGPPASTPDLRGLDHEGRPVGIETLADERFADLNGYVERSEAAQRALEERLADLEVEVAESTEALEARVSSTDPSARVSTQELEQALAATASRFEAKLRAAADEHVRKLEAAGVVTKNQLLEALARAEDGLTHAAEARATELGEMIAAARTTIERTANSRVESLESTAFELRDGIEDLHRDIAAALTQSGEAQTAALDRAASDWLKRMDKNGAKSGRRRRAAPGAAAVVLAIAAALGGTMFFRSGGSDRPSVARADSPSARTAAPATSTPEDASQVGDVAAALSSISWPSATAPLSWRAPGTGTQPGTNGSAPSNGSGTASGATAPSGGGGGQTAPAPTQPPQTSPPPTQPPPTTILPPVTVPLSGVPLPDLR
ncbi:MAG TPA: hypothetical protein VGR04_09900 [Acidimicrobiia bacterium]|nr:hypothetical protein [Acidimicrobiia bacterium]